MKIHADVAKNAKIRYAYTLPASVCVIVRNRELTMKLLSQLQLVAIEFATPIKWIG